MTTTNDKYVTRNVVDPKGVVQVYKNFWWWCEDGDPTKALFYVGLLRGRRDIGSPQCNANQEIAERVGVRLEHTLRAKLIQIPLAFVPWDTATYY
jgi:hypothetical protein